MEAPSWCSQILVKKLRGKNEFEMYENYLKDLPSGKITSVLSGIFGTGDLKKKSDFKARNLRSQGNKAYKLKDYQESLRLYTKSLRYANYNSGEYAFALANRSLIHFVLEDYKSSIDDANLCLDANYPSHLKPKVYFRKAKCFQKLGELTDMKSTLEYLLNYLDITATVITVVGYCCIIEKYKEMAKDLLTAPAEIKSDPEDKFDVLPLIKANPIFLNASSSIALEYSKQKGYHVVAKEDIVQGDVLFVEKAYVFAPVHNECDFPKKYCPVHCQYCLQKITSSVPCKGCVKHLYCNENCRDDAWKEFHQWECIGIQGQFFKHSGDVYQALRIILKAVPGDVFADAVSFKNPVASFGNQDNNYPYVYNLLSCFNTLETDLLMNYVAAAVLVVNYLKMETNFFEWMKQLPAYTNKSCQQLMNKLGGLMIRHLTQMHRSSVPITICDNEPIPGVIVIAGAVCPSVSMMNHSCIPNTTCSFIGSTVVVKAIKDIKVNQEICHSIDGISFNAMDKAERRTMLQKFYNLECTCQLCSDPRMDTHDAYLCIKCNGPAPLDHNCYQFGPKQCICLNCNYKFTLPSTVAVKERLALSFLGRSHQRGNIEDANRSLEICKQIFRPNHSIFEELYQKLFIYYKTKGEVEGLIQIGKLLVDYYEKKYSILAMQLGVLQYKLCVHVVNILQETAVNIDVKDLGEMLAELTNFLEKAKTVFSFQYPQFGSRLQKMEKSIGELRILHTMQIAKTPQHGHM